MLLRFFHAILLKHLIFFGISFFEKDLSTSSFSLLSLIWSLLWVSLSLIKWLKLIGVIFNWVISSNDLWEIGSYSLILSTWSPYSSILIGRSLLTVNISIISPLLLQVPSVSAVATLSYPRLVMSLDNMSKSYEFPLFIILLFRGGRLSQRF